MSDEMPLSDGERLMECLQNLWRGWCAGTLRLPPREVDPLYPCDCAGVNPELVVEDAWGWSLHVPGGVVRYDATWTMPYRFLTVEDWAYYADMLDVAEDLGLGPADVVE